MDDVDYGATSEALARRTEKARRIETWCWERAITPTDLDACTPDQSQAIARQALGRAGTAEDIVGPAIFLASDLSAYVSGSIVMVDGGYRAV